MKVRNAVIAGFGALFVLGLGVPAMAEGDAKAGKRVFAKCRACHKLEAGKHGVGPSLHNIVGREVAAADGFTKYSKAMKAFGEGKTWDEASCQRHEDGVSRPAQARAAGRCDRLSEVCRIDPFVLDGMGFIGTGRPVGRPVLCR